MTAQAWIECSDRLPLVGANVEAMDREGEIETVTVRRDTAGRWADPGHSCTIRYFGKDDHLPRWRPTGRWPGVNVQDNDDVDGEIEPPAGDEPVDFDLHCDNKSASVKIVNGFAMTLADALCDSIGGNYLQVLAELPEDQDPSTALLELTGDVESRRGRRFGISVVFRDLVKPTLAELHRKERDRADALEAEVARLTERLRDAGRSLG